MLREACLNGLNRNLRIMSSGQKGLVPLVWYRAFQILQLNITR